jgi:hypothetical protein
MKEIPAPQAGASCTVPRETIPVRIREAVPEDAAELHRVVSEAMELYRLASGIPCGKLDAGSETVANVRDAISSVPVFVAVLPDGSIAGSVRLIEKNIGSFPMPLPHYAESSPSNRVPASDTFPVSPCMQTCRASVSEVSSTGRPRKEPRNFITLT